jgi:hypothetical protein
VPVGTTFSFTLDQAATVTLKFTHTGRGRKVSGKCVARSARNALKPVCTRPVSDGSLRVQARSGSSKLHFEGKVSRLVKLKPGSYAVAITATGAAGTVSVPKTLRFTVIA